MTPPAMDFERWREERERPGSFAHSMRAVYNTGLTFAEALRLFRFCFMAEAVLACEGNRGLAAEEINVMPVSIWRQLRSAGFGAKDIQRMTKKKEEAAQHGN